jgi:hypothetical protein
MPQRQIGLACAVFASVLALAGCGSSTCDELQNSSFSSSAEQICDDTVTPPTMCSWTLDFRNGRYTWRRGTAEELGDFNCSGNAVTGTTVAGEARSASYDAASATLTWEGVSYQRL